MKPSSRLVMTVISFGCVTAALVTACEAENADGSRPPEATASATGVGQAGAASAGAGGVGGASPYRGLPPPVPPGELCATERNALLTSLLVSQGPCATSDDCSYYAAWALAGASPFCNRSWPVVNRDGRSPELDAKNKALYDCLAAAGAAPGGSCAMGQPPPVCDTGKCWWAEE